MLVEKVDTPLVNTFGNRLSDLMRSSSLNHVQPSPAVFGLGTRRGANEERVFQLALEVVLFHMVGQKRRNLPAAGM